MRFYGGLVSSVVDSSEREGVISVGLTSSKQADKAGLGIGAHQAVLAHYEADNIAIGQPRPTHDALFLRIAVSALAKTTHARSAGTIASIRVSSLMFLAGWCGGLTLRRRSSEAKPPRQL